MKINLPVIRRVIVGYLEGYVTQLDANLQVVSETDIDQTLTALKVGQTTVFDYDFKTVRRLKGSAFLAWVAVVALVLAPLYGGVMYLARVIRDVAVAAYDEARWAIADVADELAEVHDTLVRNFRIALAEVRAAD